MKTIDRIKLAVTNPELLNRVKAFVGFDVTTLIGIEDLEQVLLPKHIEKIRQAIPHCVKMNGVLFLVGSRHNFEDKNTQNDFEIYELYDMTTEMKSGHSYSIYSMVTDYFDKASAEEVLEVVKFLEKQ